MNNEINKETKERLKQYIEAIEFKESEKNIIQDKIRELFNDAKSEGFDVKAMKAVIKLRKKDQNQIEQEEYLLETYKEALGLNN